MINYDINIIFIIIIYYIYYILSNLEVFWYKVSKNNNIQNFCPCKTLVL